MNYMTPTGNNATHSRAWSASASASKTSEFTQGRAIMSTIVNCRSCFMAIRPLRRTRMRAVKSINSEDGAEKCRACSRSSPPNAENRHLAWHADIWACDVHMVLADCKCAVHSRGRLCGREPTSMPPDDGINKSWRIRAAWA